MDHSRSPMPSRWGKSRPDPRPEGRGAVKLAPLRRRSRRERELGSASCSCPRLCVIIIIQCYSMESGSVESTPTLHRGRPMRRVFRLSWVILLLALALAYAEIYKWVDRDGKVHFSDTL